MTKPVRCRATNRLGEQCRRYCPAGATVCASHGAKAPQVRRAAAARAAQTEARTLAEAMEIKIDTDPIDAIRTELNRSATIIGLLAQQDDLTTGEIRRALLAEREHMVRVAVAAAKVCPAAVEVIDTEPEWQVEQRRKEEAARKLAQMFENMVRSDYALSPSRRQYGHRFTDDEVRFPGERLPEPKPLDPPA